MKVAIIDGNNLAYKLYATFKESKGGLLHSSAGIPTTVIYGLVRMLGALAKKSKFDQCIVCWDVGGGSAYRKSIYPEYKANRKEKKIDLTDYYAEVESAREYLKEFGFNQGIVKGVEADDVIGWLAVTLRDRGHTAIIVSDDKDFYQLCGRRLKIYRPIKDDWMTSSDVCDEFGLKRCSDFARMRALTGDPKDNIPGFRGMGPKTAVKLFNEYSNNLGLLIANCDHERWGPIIQEGEEQIWLSYSLSKIRCKDRFYDSSDLKKLKCIQKTFDKPIVTDMRMIQHYKTLLEIKTPNFIQILKMIGIKIKGKPKGKVGSVKT